MKIISKLSDLIDEELSDADKYISLALNTREDLPNLSATFYKLSTEEINHVNMLHEQVVFLISEYCRSHGEPPEKMQAIYDYIHDKHISKANEIKIAQALYKG